MYSDMSSWISAASSPKRNSASVFAAFGDEVHLLALPLALTRLALAAKLVLLLARARSRLVVLDLDRRFLLALNQRDGLVELAEVGRNRHAHDPHAAAGLVDEVD